jgi:hypothetical protein
MANLSKSQATALNAAVFIGSAFDCRPFRRPGGLRSQALVRRIMRMVRDGLLTYDTPWPSATEKGIDALKAHYPNLDYSKAVRFGAHWKAWKEAPLAEAPEAL